MKPSLHIHKFTPPHLPPILQRKRLVDFIDQKKDRKLFLILGQAAQGKSTVASSYVQQSSTPAIWINLGPEDSDPVNLYFSLVHSLQQTLVDVDLSPLLDYPGMAIGPKAEIPMFQDWINEFIDVLPSPVLIVLDGLDRLSSDAPSWQFLQILFDQASTKTTFIILSRSVPPINIHRMRMNQEAAILENKDLAFTQGETKWFFKDIRGMTFDSKGIRKIYQVTEGWVGGLVLLAEALDKMPAEHRGKYISEGISNGFKEQTFGYFNEEIFSLQKQSVQELLIKSSILDILEPSFVNNLLGTENTKEILQNLANRNFFMYSIYEESKGWLFRYHQLFKDFLQSRFEAIVGQEEKRKLFFKAASLYERRGDLETSLRHYLEAKAHSEAASIIEQIGMDLIKSGRTSDLSKWIERLPEDMIQENPWLLLYLSMCRRFTGLDQHIDNLQKCLVSFEKKTNTVGQLLALGYLIESSIYRGRDAIPVHRLIEKSEKLQNSLHVGKFNYEKSVLWSQIGFGYVFRSGNERKAFNACQNAFIFAKSIGDLFLQFTALSYSVIALANLGEFRSADEICERIEKLIEKYSNPDVYTFYLINSSHLSLLKGDLDKAAELVDRVQYEVEKHGLIYQFAPILIYQIWLKIYFLKTYEVEEIANHLVSITTSLGNNFLHGACLFFLGLCFYHAEKVEKSKEFLDRSHQILSSSNTRSEAHINQIKIIKGMILFRLEEYSEAEMLLQEAQNHYKRLSSHLHLSETYLAMSLIKWKQGNCEEAEADLRTGVKIAMERNYDHFPILSPNDIVRACVLSIELELNETFDYIKHLLAIKHASRVEPELVKLSQSTNSKIRRKIRDIRQAIHRSTLSCLNIKTLGDFQVFRGDSPIDQEEWQRNQPKLLLKAIIAHGVHRIPKDRLIEDLWPESTPTAAERSFKVNLHRLRKTLEPSMDKAFGSSYIHLKDNIVFLDNELCSIDMDAFLTLVIEGDEKKDTKDYKAAEKLYRAALDKYKGGFLPNDFYFSWVNEKRVTLKRKYFELLLNLANIYEIQGAITKAISFYKTLISEDPLFEKAYQRLMVLYSSQGKSNEVVKVYESCKLALRESLDTVPDELTTAIYEKATENL